jgi:hypothetical protein
MASLARALRGGVRAPGCFPATSDALGVAEAKAAQTRQLGTMVDFLRENTAWHVPLDWDGIARSSRSVIEAGDGSEKTFFAAIYGAFDSVPQGHQFLSIPGCGRVAPMANVSQRGVCGRPHARGIVVTNARLENPLGLAPGDLVTRIGDEDAIRRLGHRPMCGASHPSTSYRETTVASTFADLIAPGEALVVERPDGSMRTFRAEVGDLTGDFSHGLGCEDVMARPPGIRAELRDGVGILRLHTFMDVEEPFPTDPAELDAYDARFIDKIRAAFDTVKHARALVWDVRGNGGGRTPVALAIASGFPGASSETISFCRARVPGSNPPALSDDRYAVYALTPGGPFAYDGRVAVLIDGLDYSAADYFPLAVATRTKALLVGAPTAGAFGAGSKTKVIDGVISVTVDVNRCMSPSDGEETPLEGRNTAPHIRVDPEPGDLARGVDTVLERALAAIRD